MTLVRACLAVALVGAVAACPRSSHPDRPAGGCEPGAPGCTGESDPPPPPPPARTEIEQRRDAACEALGPRLTECAIADARRTMSPQELAELDIERTAPIHTREFVESCKEKALSSRQVRVYEVCLREERECDPLVACLDNAAPGADE